MGTAYGNMQNATDFRGLYRQALQAALISNCFLNCRPLDSGKFSVPISRTDLNSYRWKQFRVSSSQQTWFLFCVGWKSLALLDDQSKPLHQRGDVLGQGGGAEAAILGGLSTTPCPASMVRERETFRSHNRARFLFKNSQKLSENVDKS